MEGPPPEQLHPTTVPVQRLLHPAPSPERSKGPSSQVSADPMILIPSPQVEHSSGVEIDPPPQ